MRMDSRRSQKKRTIVEEVDRLSSLPDDLIHKIFSYMGIKDTIGTSTLSSRWRYIWTSMSCLEFSDWKLSTLPKFSNFVTEYLSRRNNQTEVFSLNLSYDGQVTEPFVKKLLDYAYSHNIQQLDISYASPNWTSEFPLSLFSSQSLKHLSFTFEYGYCDKFLPTTSSFELPALTTLYLCGLTLCSDNCIVLFSKCPNLKNLTLSRWSTKESNDFTICHPQLTNLTLERGHSVKVVNVVVPQLEILVIRDRSSIIRYVISSPNLASLVYSGYDPLHLSTDGFPSLKEADICVLYPNNEAHHMVCLLQRLHNVKFLRLNLEIVKLLSSCVELISHQPSPFVNLSSLTIFPKRVSREVRPKKMVTVSAEVEHYLLDSSPGATFMMVLREEIRAKKHMAKLRKFLGEEKADTETSRTRLGRKRAPAQTNIYRQGKSQAEAKILHPQFRKSMAQIKTYWVDLIVDIEQRKAKVFRIISKLQKIEKLLMKLPASKRALIQPCFSSLCAESNIVMNEIADFMKMR
uniref:F-box/FBD/LRR-repeat protein At5g56420-like n=1 Tax=Erigeron canadensis TaxID=72917 RepID=UPI001CB972DE|nr:F-box/FBD/LRR-repeat protein At5g56420-like [Erigeron canadensis]